MTPEKLSAEIKRSLLEKADEKYKRFTEPLISTASLPVIGVRLPEIKAIAKRLSPYYKEIFGLNFEYFEEVMLCGMALGVSKAPLSEKLPYMEKFLMKIDNWSVCDSFCSALKIKCSEEELLKKFIQSNIFSSQEFIARAAVVLWFGKFHDEQSCEKAFSDYEKMTVGRYYTDMAIAWGISVYCVYFPGKAVSFLDSGDISTAIKKKAAQKIRDSRRISEEVKAAATKAVGGGVNR